MVLVILAAHGLLMAKLHRQHLAKWQNSAVLWAREYMQNHKNHQVQFNIGTILEEEGKSDLAIELYKQSFYGRLANVPSCELLIKALTKENKIKEATGYLRACITKHGEQEEFNKLKNILAAKN
jgi:lipopolysaccharide biosynthesis regulator YciM